MHDIDLAKIEGLSMRAINCCNEVGIVTIGDLFEYVKCRSLTTIRNCGIKTAKELMRTLESYESQIMGFKYDLFSVDYEDVQVADTEAPQYVTVTETAESIQIKTLDGLYQEHLGILATQMHNKVRKHFPNFNSLLQIIMRQPEMLFSTIEGWTIEDHFKFWDFCLSTLTDMADVVDAEVCPDIKQTLTDACTYIRANERTKKLTFVHNKLSRLLVTAEID